MSTPLIVPFNFQPVSSARGTTATYTVPAGKYSLVTIQYDISFSYTVAGLFNSSGSSVGTGTTGNGISSSFNIWMKAGETLTLAASNSTGTNSYSAGGASGYGMLNATAVGAFNTTINGTLWKITQSRQAATVNAFVQALGTATITVTPVTNFGWYAQEYNEIS